MSELALLGGEPLRSAPFPGGPMIDESERSAVARVLDSGNLSGFIGVPGEPHLGGPEVRALEGRWQTLGNYEAVVAVNSATAALHAGVVALELESGAEVVVPPYTMSATPAAVRMAGLQPVFADIDLDLFTLTAGSIEAVLTPRTQAILVVHLFGQMAPMEEIRDLAARKGLRVLEDAAQSPFATQAGAWPGTGTAGAIFSFNQHKTITCGEGGLLATGEERVRDIARLVRNHGESVVSAFPHVDGRNLIGWNYRLTEIDAAIAFAQTEKAEWLTDWRIALAERLTKGLAQIRGIEEPVIPEANKHVYFRYPVRFSEQEWGVGRDVVVRALLAEGMPCAGGYVEPLYRLPLFRDDKRNNPANFPVCELLASEELLLINACQWPVAEAEIDQVVAAFEKCWSSREALRSFSEDR